jgi:DNA mismatch repair protein MutL
MPIKQLAPDVAAKIAAGEVVERPASVVKELIENSIDAGATHIRVDLMHGGLQLIRVTDNGCGIAAEELPLALARHATSKVAQIDDLEHIRSLGFRGEALASIAAVAEVTLVSRPKDGEQAAQIATSEGQISEVSTAASPEGTSITVRNLFSAVPARLKFLKSRNTEVSHCHHLLEQYALAYPEIRFNVTSDGRQIFATPGNGQLASVLVEVYGLQVAEQMIEVQGTAQDDTSDYPLVTGYSSRPACYKSTRQHISFFVNRRWVMSRMLTAAVENAYNTLLLKGRHPVAVINVQIDPSQLDVNVHPAKTEIRFLKERRVFSAILHAVHNALLEEPQMPHWQSNKEESSTSENAEGDEIDQELAEALADEPEAAGEQESRHIPADNPWMTVSEEESGTQPPIMSRLWQSHVQTDERQQADAKDRQPQTQSSEQAEEIDDIVQQHPITKTTHPASSHAPKGTTLNGWQLPNIEGEQQSMPLERTEQQQAVDVPSLGAHINARQRQKLPRLRVIGQLSQSYIVTEGEDGMYLIDQHAAHERILLERMVAALKEREAISQLLLTPLELELAPSELEALEEHLDQLTSIGFALEVLDHHTIQVKAVPSVLVKHVSAHSVHELLLELSTEENLGHTESWEERALANVACKAAIKANYFLTVSEMREMLEQLEQTKAPYSCCHGRPTTVHFGLSSLEREFGRR